MEIVLASRNKGKIRELRELLSETLGESVIVKSLDDINFSDEIIEDGKTFEENAMIKARAISRLGYIGVGDDSGLSVIALDGAPGIYSARYAGEHGNDDANNNKLLAELDGKENREASFVCAVACSFPDGSGYEDFVVRGECKGYILHEKHGKGGFGYDPLFYSPESGKSFAELTDAEKNSLSHRGRAMRKFAERIKKYIITEN